MVKKSRLKEVSLIIWANTGGIPSIAQLERAANMIDRYYTEELRADDIPEESEFIEYALSIDEQLNREAVRQKYLSWIDAGWYTGGKKSRKINKWKATLRNTIPYIKKDTNQMVERSNTILNTISLFDYDEFGNKIGE